MIRLFEKNTKEKLLPRIINEVQSIFEATSEKQFQTIHSGFCDWSINNITLAEKVRNGQVIKRSGPVSYGQIAKTFDVVLKVTIYYCHLPDIEKSQIISRWLNAAVDEKMMAMLKKSYPASIKPWPDTIELVDRSSYAEIQETVRKFIRDNHGDNITPVQFDDIYWKALNRQENLHSNG